MSFDELVTARQHKIVLQSRVNSSSIDFHVRIQFINENLYDVYDTVTITK